MKILSKKLNDILDDGIFGQIQEIGNTVRAKIGLYTAKESLMGIVAHEAIATRLAIQEQNELLRELISKLEPTKVIVETKAEEAKVVAKAGAK